MSAKDSMGFGAFGGLEAAGKTKEPADAGNPGISAGGTEGGAKDTEECNKCTAVYRSPIAGMRAWVGYGEQDTACNADGDRAKGYIVFAAAGYPSPHPHDHNQLQYPYGEFCTTNEDLICCMDKLALEGCYGFERVADPVPIGADEGVAVTATA